MASSRQRVRGEVDGRDSSDGERTESSGRTEDKDIDAGGERVGDVNGSRSDTSLGNIGREHDVGLCDEVLVHRGDVGVQLDLLQSGDQRVNLSGRRGTDDDRVRVNALQEVLQQRLTDRNCRSLGLEMHVG